MDIKLAFLVLTWALLLGGSLGNDSVGRIQVYTNCEWSYCAGATISGQTTCNDYKKEYVNEYTGEGCSFTKSKVKCCKRKIVKRNNCRRTNICYGIAYGASYACRNTYGENWTNVVGENKKACDGFALYSFQCCPVN